jgi:hypothetical protein
MHHWSDVLIGMTTGSSVSAFVVSPSSRYIDKLLPCFSKAFNIVGFKLGTSTPLGQFVPLPNGQDEQNGRKMTAATTRTTIA